jgi:hypothetical protein
VSFFFFLTLFSSQFPSLSSGAGLMPGLSSGAGDAHILFGVAFPLFIRLFGCHLLTFSQSSPIAVACAIAWRV